MFNLNGWDKMYFQREKSKIIYALLSHPAHDAAFLNSQTEMIFPINQTESGLQL